jgi:hypothetical protein
MAHRKMMWKIVYSTGIQRRINNYHRCELIDDENELFSNWAADNESLKKKIAELEKQQA